MALQLTKKTVNNSTTNNVSHQIFVINDDGTATHNWDAFVTFINGSTDADLGKLNINVANDGWIYTNTVSSSGTNSQAPMIIEIEDLNDTRLRKQEIVFPATLSHPILIKEGENSSNTVGFADAAGAPLGGLEFIYRRDPCATQMRPIDQGATKLTFWGDGASYAPDHRGWGWSVTIDFNPASNRRIDYDISQTVTGTSGTLTSYFSHGETGTVYGHDASNIDVNMYLIKIPTNGSLAEIDPFVPATLPTDSLTGASSVVVAQKNIQMLRTQAVTIYPKTSSGALYPTWETMVITSPQTPKINWFGLSTSQSTPRRIVCRDPHPDLWSADGNMTTNSGRTSDTCLFLGTRRVSATFNTLLGAGQAGNLIIRRTAAYAQVSPAAGTLTNNSEATRKLQLGRVTNHTYDIGSTGSGEGEMEFASRRTTTSNSIQAITKYTGAYDVLIGRAGTQYGKTTFTNVESLVTASNFPDGLTASHNATVDSSYNATAQGTITYHSSTSTLRNSKISINLDADEITLLADCTDRELVSFVMGLVNAACGLYEGGTLSQTNFDTFCTGVSGRNFNLWSRSGTAITLDGMEVDLDTFEITDSSDGNTLVLNGTNTFDTSGTGAAIGVPYEDANKPYISYSVTDAISSPTSERIQFWKEVSSTKTKVHEATNNSGSFSSAANSQSVTFANTDEIHYAYSAYKSSTGQFHTAYGSVTLAGDLTTITIGTNKYTYPDSVTVPSVSATLTPDSTNTRVNFQWTADYQSIDDATTSKMLAENLGGSAAFVETMIRQEGSTFAHPDGELLPFQCDNRRLQFDATSAITANIELGNINNQNPSQVIGNASLFNQADVTGTLDIRIRADADSVSGAAITSSLGRVEDNVSTLQTDMTEVRDKVDALLVRDA